MTTNENQIAATILEQLGGQRAAAMIGIRHALAFPAIPADPTPTVFCPNGREAKGPGVGVRFSAKATNGANHVEIVLDPSDTYTVTFWRIRGGASHDLRKISTHDMVHADGLRPLFESETGLLLSL